MKLNCLIITLLVPFFAKTQVPAAAEKKYFLYHLRLKEKYVMMENWTPLAHANLTRHANFLDSLGKVGKLIFAGRTDVNMDDPDLFGIALVEADSLGAAKKMMAADPAVIVGIQEAEVLPFRLAISHFKNAPDQPFPKIKINQSLDHLARLQEINRDIWTPFVESYATADAEKYLALHTSDFIRATIDYTKDLGGYRSDVQQHFRWNAQNGRRCEIEFSFSERVAGLDLASERGIYKYTSFLPNGTKQFFYGKFHVMHRKVDGKWKIAVDYDSNEGDTIGEADFKAGFPPDRFAY